MSKQSKDQSVEPRRKALKGLAVGGSSALTAKWSTPVVESVMIPAHAAGTNRSGLDPGVSARVTQSIVFEEDVNGT